MIDCGYAVWRYADRRSERRKVVGGGLVFVESWFYRARKWQQAVGPAAAGRLPAEKVITSYIPLKEVVYSGMKALCWTRTRLNRRCWLRSRPPSQDVRILWVTLKKT